MNVVLKLEGYLKWEHVWLKECVPFFMAHPVTHKHFQTSESIPIWLFSNYNS